MPLTKDHLLFQLFTLRPTEEHLKSFCFYIKTFQDDSNTILNGISFVHLNSSIHHRIVLYYLINELLLGNLNIDLKSNLKKFIKANFQKDIQLSQPFEILNKRLVELERIWKSKKIIDFEDKYDIEDVLKIVKETFYEKDKFVKVLKDLIKEYEH